MMCGGGRPRPVPSTQWRSVNSSPATRPIVKNVAHRRTGVVTHTGGAVGTKVELKDGEVQTDWMPFLNAFRGAMASSTSTVPSTKQSCVGVASATQTVETVESGPECMRCNQRMEADEEQHKRISELKSILTQRDTEIERLRALMESVKEGKHAAVSKLTSELCIAQKKSQALNDQLHRTDADVRQEANEKLVCINNAVSVLETASTLLGMAKTSALKNVEDFEQNTSILQQQVKNINIELTGSKSHHTELSQVLSSLEVQRRESAARESAMRAELKKVISDGARRQLELRTLLDDANATSAMYLASMINVKELNIDAAQHLEQLATALASQQSGDNAASTNASDSTSTSVSDGNASVSETPTAAVTEDVTNSLRHALETSEWRSKALADKLTAAQLQLEDKSTTIEDLKSVIARLKISCGNSIRNEESESRRMVRAQEKLTAVMAERDGLTAIVERKDDELNALSDWATKAHAKLQHFQSQQQQEQSSPTLSNSQIKAYKSQEHELRAQIAMLTSRLRLAQARGFGSERLNTPSPSSTFSPANSLERRSTLSQSMSSFPLRALHGSLDSTPGTTMLPSPLQQDENIISSPPPTSASSYDALPLPSQPSPTRSWQPPTGTMSQSSKTNDVLHSPPSSPPAFTHDSPRLEYLTNDGITRVSPAGARSHPQVSPYSSPQRSPQPSDRVHSMLFGQSITTTSSNGVPTEQGHWL